MEALKIITLCVAAAVVYGILHDQVTARVCVEYFTIGHPPVFNTESPTLLAIGWGIIATWWVGVMLGVPAALACRIGSWPKFTAGQLVKPLALLLVVMAIGALVAGIAGYNAAQAGKIQLLEPLASRIAPEKHAAFLADLWTHITSYALGFIGGWVIISYVVFARWHATLVTISQELFSSALFFLGCQAYFRRAATGVAFLSRIVAAGFASGAVRFVGFLAAI